MALETILYEVDDHVATITLNRPQKLNAISSKMDEELIQVLGEGDKDPAVKVMVLRGAGRAFCAGADLVERANKEASDPELVISQFRRGFANTRLWEISKVVIAMVHGQCVAGGCQMVGMCDLTFASEDAYFWEPEIRFVNPILVPITIYLLGLKNAKEFYLSGDPVSASDAQRMGLINRVYPKDDLERETYAFARRIAAYPASGLTMMKRSVNRVYDAMGMKLMTDVDTEILAYAMALQERTGGDAEFRKLVREKGLKTAVAMRDGSGGTDKM